MGQQRPGHARHLVGSDHQHQGHDVFKHNRLEALERIEGQLLHGAGIDRVAARNEREGVAIWRGSRYRFCADDPGCAWLIVRHNRLSPGPLQPFQSRLPGAASIKGAIVVNSAANHVREGRQNLRALPALLILQAEEDLSDLTAPQEFAQRHRDERSGHPHAVLLRVASTRPPRSGA